MHVLEVSKHKMGELEYLVVNENIFRVYIVV